jgi:hypothetical protein
MKNIEGDLKKSFWWYYFNCVVKPRKTFPMIVIDNRLLRFGFYAVSLNAIVYTLVYVFLILGGGTAFKPWLNISPGDYYTYNVFFLTPSMFLAWILAGGVMQLLSKLSGGSGSFENTLGVIGFGIGIASWATGIHDLLTSFLGAVRIIDQNGYEHSLNTPTFWRSLLWVQFAVYFVWFVAMFAIGTQSVQRMKKTQSVLVGLAGFLIYQFFFFIFNR